MYIYFSFSVFTVQEALPRPAPRCTLSLLHTCQTEAGAGHSPAQQHGLGEISARDTAKLKEESLDRISTVCSQIVTQLQKQTVAHIESIHQATAHGLGLRMGLGAK